MKNCHIFDIDDFKTFLVNTTWCDGTKQNNVDVYRCYARYKGLKAENLPKYNREYPLPFIPLEKEVDALISGCGRKTSTLLQLLKETAFRPHALKILLIGFFELVLKMPCIIAMIPMDNNNKISSKFSHKDT